MCHTNHYVRTLIDRINYSLNFVFGTSHFVDIFFILLYSSHHMSASYTRYKRWTSEPLSHILLIYV